MDFLLYGKPCKIDAICQMKGSICIIIVAAIRFTIKWWTLLDFSQVSKGNEVYALKTESLKEKVKDMRKKLPGQKFSMVCALSVGIQCLEAIEELHTIGFLHRDIKPSNYATGRGKLSELRRIYILDFGMCRSYLDEHGRFRPPRKTAGFRGTVRYASLSSHIRRETCRKDDIESWLYQQIEVTRGALPWCSLDDKKDDVAMFKERCRFETGLQELMGGCPQEYIEILRYIDSLRFYDNPNYKKIYKLMRKAMSVL
ncbi:Tau-tubulin kinase [Dirofilaria immitis]